MKTRKKDRFINVSELFNTVKLENESESECLRRILHEHHKDVLESIAIDEEHNANLNTTNESKVVSALCNTNNVNKKERIINMSEQTKKQANLKKELQEKNDEIARLKAEKDALTESLKKNTSTDSSCKDVRFQLIYDVVRTEKKIDVTELANKVDKLAIAYNYSSNVQRVSRLVAYAVDCMKASKFATCNNKTVCYIESATEDKK